MVASTSSRSHRPPAAGPDRSAASNGSCVMRRFAQIDTSIHAAALSAAALIAHQVAGKAARDALFLSYFPVSGLGWMVMAASVISIALGFAGSRLMSSIVPGRLVPRAF